MSYDLERLPDGTHVVTCMYCGSHCPGSTRTHAVEILKGHTAECKKHPMFALRKDRDQLRAALANLVGASTLPELYAMKLTLLRAPGFKEAPDAGAIVGAIDALIISIELEAEVPSV